MYMETGTGLSNLDQWGFIFGKNKLYDRRVFVDYDALQILNVIFTLNNDISKYKLHITNQRKVEYRDTEAWYTMSGSGTNGPSYLFPSSKNTSFMLIISGEIEKGCQVEMNVNATDHSWEFVMKLVDNNKRIARMYQTNVLDPTYKSIVYAIKEGVDYLTKEQ